MLTGKNGILSRAGEARYSNEIAQFDEKVKLAQISLQASITNKSKVNPGYIATEASNFVELVGEVANDVGLKETDAIQGGNGTKINTEGYTVGYYLDTEGSDTTDGIGYIVVWYTDNSLRASIDRDEVINKYGIKNVADASDSRNQATLVRVIVVGNYDSNLSDTGLTSTTDGETDIAKGHFEDTTLNKDDGIIANIAKDNPNPNVTPSEDDDTLTPVADIANYLKVGDYVAYDPLHTDLAGTQVVESSKLTYTSPTGTGQSHGNGYTSSETGGGQTFTAKSGINWRVLSITPEIVELIPEVPITKDDTSNNSGNFILNGKVAYLYAEQELHEICKIYGYGYGTYKGQNTEYTIGGPLDKDENGNELKGKITGSGARSMTVEDINKIAKIGEVKDGINVTTTYTELDGSSYGITTNPTSYVYYPTTTTLDGKSASAGIKNLKSTMFWYEKSRIVDTISQNLIFTSKSYWLASRELSSDAPKAAYYGIRVVYDDGIGVGTGSRGYTSGMEDGVGEDYAIRPCVSIKSSLINISNSTAESGKDVAHAWKLK